MTLELHVIDYGAFMICLEGCATININFKSYAVKKGDAACFFPAEAVKWEETSSNFRGIMLRYDAEILREASMNMEQAVYHFMREDRVITKQALQKEVMQSMFRKLSFYFRQPDCLCVDAIVVLELKSFFIGLNDFLQRQQIMPHSSQTTNANTHFYKFMQLLESDYRKSHDVQYYADRLCITRKYLNMVSKKCTGLSPKHLIDEYLMLQIKLTLQNTHKSIKEIAVDFHFDDVSFFVRYFKAHAGMPPLQYRRSNMR
ncbi:MAG: helix-turn-helix domain-containing protein [Prevotella sp.]|nr:helix-turn-helix domain-containing protein [Prevotella sp.]